MAGNKICTYDTKTKNLTAPGIFKQIINENSRISMFSSPEATSEFYISVDLNRVKSRSFDYCLKAVSEEYSSIFKKFNLNEDSLALMKLFVDDLAFQPQVIKGFLQSNSKANKSVIPATIIQQSPSLGSKISLMAYHIKSPKPIKKEKIIYSSPDANARCHCYSVSLEHYKYIWMLNMMDQQAATRYNTYLQTSNLFNYISDMLKQHNGTVANNILRTWIYVDKIYSEYEQMNKGRTEVFYREGLLPETHFIASTGIEGKMSRLPGVSISINALSIFGMKQNQITYLRPHSAMNVPCEYNSTFERGAKVEYGDRTHIYISGTASIDKYGEVIHLENILKQTEHTFFNIEAVLKDAGASMSDMIFMIVYLRDSHHAIEVKKFIDELSLNIPYVLLDAPVCRPEWLVEMEGIAVNKKSNPSFRVF